MIRIIRWDLSLRQIGAALTGFFLIMYLVGNHLLDTLELKTYDMRLTAGGARVPDGEIVIAAIDEKSLAAMGRWPWSRGVIANLVRKLDELGARVIAFDVFFAEPENRNVLEQIRQLENEPGAGAYGRLKQTLDTDGALSRAVKQSGRVVLPIVFLMSSEETRQQSPIDAARADAGIQAQAIQLIKDSGDGHLDFPLPNPAGVVVNLPALTANAKFTGHINYLPDSDGAVRRAPLIMRYNGLFFPSADVQTVRLYQNLPHLALRTASYGITGLEIGDRLIATDESGRALIHYHGPEKTFATYSVSDIYSGNISPARIKNKLVLIGTTAIGIGDIRLTPYAAKYPGVEIRANTIQNLLEDDFIHRPDWMSIVDGAIIAGLGIFLVMVLPRLDMRVAIWFTFALLVAYAALAFGLFRGQHIWLNVVYPSLLTLTLFVSSTILKYFSVETEKRQIKGAFQHYVPAQVVEKIMENIDNLGLGGEKRELTVLFSDIRGFTTISEALAPEELVKLLNVYLTRMTDKVFKHNGLLDKYIGDAIMAVYGAPIAHPDHARLACRTALEMLREMHSLREEWKKSGLPDMDMGVGINTGSMVVGNMGSKNRFDYTVIGDAVNLGSRIESLNKIYGTHILLSEFTYRQVRDEFPHTREIDVTHVKGRQEIVRLYELMLPWQYPHMDWLPEFARAYELFRAGLLGKARAVFEHLHKTLQDPVSNYYAQRCKATRRKGGAVSF